MSKKSQPPATTPATGSAAKSQRAHILADRIWLVLARKAYEEPLRQVGTVEADDPELASVYARSIYDEFAWVEMAVVPRDALITVIES
ncbi:MAG: hypothetical protein OJF49_001441 [Ktedonobacterales bacterium]|jgi:1,2-phenylacetyl-CoA epoxidase PaaB subunit|nr:MAG: hypothetical protein OJF49_001441 [Ktedonobacterales bacterium]